MSHLRIYISLIVTLFLLSGAAWATGSEDKTIELIDRTITRMERGQLQDIWALSAEMKELALRAREPAVERILSAAHQGNQIVKLGCAKTLIELDEEKASVPLMIELAGQDQEKAIRLSAIAILGSTAYLNEKVNSRVEKFLNETLEADPDPVVLVEAAKALYEVSDHRYRSKAKGLLKKMLDSDIREIEIRSALALAEIGDIESCVNTLREIKDDPSYEGRMANLILKAREWERYLINTIHEKHMGVDERSFGGQTAQGLELISEIIEIVQQRHIKGAQYLDPDGVEKLLTAAAKGILNYMDPHSTYFSQREHERWIMDLERKYAGIGAYVNTIDGIFTIVRPIYSGPAYDSGLRSGDQIWKVDGWETFQQPDEEIIRRLKGQPNTMVKVTIYRSGWKEERDFSIIRNVINIPSVNAELLPGGIAYIEVSQFAAGTSKELKARLQEAMDQGAEGLILDMRNNSGGYLNEAVQVCSLFLEGHKLVVYTQGRKTDPGKGRPYNTLSMKVWDKPMVVLVNRRSASASEIVSGALQHYGRAEIIGEKTYGKGSVQNPMPLTSRWPERFTDGNGNGIFDQGEDYEDLNNNDKYDIGPMLKVTSAMYYLPSGRSIHTLRDEEGVVINQGGVTPDSPIKYEGVEAWKEEELADMLEEEAFKNYLDQHYPENTDLFITLAEGDDFDVNRYPGFQAFYDSLNTHLTENDIRKWIRVEARRRVPDDRDPPRPFPGFGFYGDYQEDSQLQAGILNMLEEIDRDPHNIQAYRKFADKEFEKPRSAMMEEKDAAKAETGEKEKGPGKEN